MTARHVLRGVDASEWTGPISRETFRHLWDRGVRVFIAQAWGGGPVYGRANDYYHQAVDAAQAAGLKVAAYCWPPADWADCLEWMRGTRESVTTLALDVEAGAGVSRSIIQAVRAAQLDPVIYCSPNSWATIMDDSRDPIYGSCPLWLARYVYATSPGIWWPDNIRDAFGAVNGRPRTEVGPWSLDDLGGWQFQGSTPAYGETFDLNLVYADMLEPKQEDEMPDLTELISKVDGLREVANLTRWSQAIGDQIRADAAVLEEAAHRIRSGHKISDFQASGVREALTRWTQAND